MIRMSAEVSSSLVAVILNDFWRDEEEVQTHQGRGREERQVGAAGKACSRSRQVVSHFLRYS